MDGTGIFLIGLVMLAGLIGTVLPLVPGIPLIWGAALVYGLMEGFGAVGTIAFGAITVLAIAGMAAAFALPHRRLTAGGASRSTIVAGVVGAVIGFFVIPVLGLPIGAAVAILLSEHRRSGDWGIARRRTKDVLVGFGLGVMVEMAAAIMMISGWVLWVFFD